MKNLKILLLILIISCSDISRNPSSNSDLLQLLNSISKEVDKDITSTKQCVEKTKFYYDKFYEIDGKNVNLEDLSKFEVESLIKASFEVRLKIREKLVNLEITNKNSGKKCLAGARDVTRVLRYFEDYLVEQFYANPEESFTTLEGNFPILLVNPKYNFSSWQGLASGDILLSRGNAYTSAAIARLGRSDAQFSHLTFVYRDSESKLHTTESHIEIGAVVNPFRVHIDQKNARTVVFRYKDLVQAHNASELIYNRVKTHTEEKGKNIRYDFSMNYKNGEGLFCSEVAYYGFKHSQNIEVPLYKTSFNPKLKSFLRPLGVKENLNNFETFFPADLEFDPRFELIAEWRDPNLLMNSRVKDAVLTKMFDWIENKGYSFRPGVGTNTKAVAAWVLRKTPWLKKGFVERFPNYMKVSQLKLFLTLDTVGEILQSKIDTIQKQKEYTLTPKEMFKILDKYREEDANKKLSKSEFHKYFRK